MTRLRSWRSARGGSEQTPGKAACNVAAGEGITSEERLRRGQKNKRWLYQSPSAV